MGRNVYYPDPDLTDYSDNADYDSDSEEPIPSLPSTQTEVDIEDATFKPGVVVPAASNVTTYVQLLQHFGQSAILYHAFLTAFRNCSSISSRS
jgi:hypothetical protein